MGQKRAHVFLDPQTPDQQMHMLRHIDKCSEMTAELGTRIVDATGEFDSPRVVGEQRHSAVARESQFVNVARLVIMPDSLAMPLWGSHGDATGLTAGVFRSVVRDHAPCRKCLQIDPCQKLSGP